MNNNKKKIAEVLRRAIKGEEEGYCFYDFLYKKAVNQDAKRKLENLRDDEARHKKTITNIYHEHIGPEIGKLPEAGIDVLTEFFRAGSLKEHRSEMEFINLAIEAELAATKYYQEKQNVIKEPELKEVFERLSEEEHQHYELLIAEREALSGNYHWFSYDESSPMEY